MNETLTSGSHADAWIASYRALRTLVERHGKHGSTPDADFLVAEENQGGDPGSG